MSDRDPSVARSEPVGLPTRDRLRRDRPELERAELRQHVLVEQLLVVQQRLQCQMRGVRSGLGRVDVIDERDPPTIDRDDRPHLLPPPDLRSERDRIALSVKRLRSVAIALPPAHSPAHQSSLQYTPLDLHHLQDLTLVVAVHFLFSYGPPTSPVPPGNPAAYSTQNNEPDYPNPSFAFTRGGPGGWARCPCQTSMAAGLSRA